MDEQMRIDEITNRYITIGAHSDLMNNILKGINPYTSEKLTGSPEEIKTAQEQLLERVQHSLGYNLGFNASKAGNVGFIT